MIRKQWRRIAGIILVIGLAVTGCTGQETASTPENSPVAAALFANVVTASGEVVPLQWATLSFEIGGQLEWLVMEGSQVAEGEALARLDTTDLDHAVAQARAALATAQAQLTAAKAGATTEEIAAAEAAVVAAQGSVTAAKAAVAQAEANAQIARANLKQAEGAEDAAAAALTQAQGTLDAAKADLARAQAELSRLQAGATSDEIAIYQAKVDQANWELWFLTNVHKQFIDNDIGGAPEEQARYQKEAAQAGLDAAQAQLDLIKAGATENEVAAAQAAVSAAQAQVTVAQAGVAAAEATLAQAQDAVDAAQGQVTLADAGVTAAEAQVVIAEGQLDQAEAQRDQLKAGATVEEIAVLEAQVAQAEAALTQAESTLTKATLVAPFAGTVGTVYPRAGEMVAPGTPAMVLGDVTVLLVETSDLNEVDAAQVVVGDSVTVTFDALPGQTVRGQVVRLAPMASVSQGGTNFTAVIELASLPETLRWGMTAFVDIEVSR